MGGPKEGKVGKSQRADKGPPPAWTKLFGCLMSVEMFS